MGEISIDITGKGKSISNAFNKLCNEAEKETGRDYYSGKINNCILHSDISNMVNTKTDIKAVEYAVKNAKKTEVYGWCVKQPIKNERLGTYRFIGYAPI